MFKVFILGLLTLLGGVYLTILVKEDPGYALLSYGNWSVEMTIALLVVILGAIILLSLMSVYLFLKMMDIPGNLLSWNKQRRVNSATTHSIKGFVELAEGKWKSAERHLNKNIDDNKMALLNYLAAAKVAQEQGHKDQRDNYLMQAFQHFPDAEVAIGLTQAELEIGAEQYQQALITLLHLRTLASNHQQVLRLLMQVYKHTSSWKELEVLLKDLRAYRVIGQVKLQQLEKEVYKHVLRELASSNKREEMIERWGKLARNIRIDGDMCCYYSELLLEVGAHDQAAELIKALLKREWNVKAIAIYGQIMEQDGAKQLIFAETFLEKYPANPVLLFTLGKISLANQLWGKARDYIQESVLLVPDSDRLYELGNLYETRLDDKNKALQCYREGLLLAEPNKIKMPVTNRLNTINNQEIVAE
ncbi:MAG: heme biosynthesis HemY N-terminal domain-containing protein [Pseudomonadota bacterium]